ncbi:ankyrin repeat and LEM domain-containing protein 2 homolog [Stomoxys calcitrans]|uniref:ankyrin repeat and LEM domain-containing protein 2 homolog n=1 Tax=Stomoxys calcitrans TaxID=35570 RepID=UPI0027E2EC15|nr:ankyrin repeat and LEM domain-containing protein 2 homolog [Stomoxys calcitrans]
MPYYGLYIPVKGGGSTTSGTTSNQSGSSSGNDDAAASNDNVTESQLVFKAKADALKVLKKHKDARLKEFSIEEDAIKYAKTGFEIVQQKYNDVRTSTASLETPAFRAPTKQELVRFRKLIEDDDYNRVKQTIWDNPRYLVSSGDTPTTLKEGYRYNAMHVCALSNRPQIAELILKTVSDTKFADLLTGKKYDQKMCQELCINLLDYYLNIPEKGRSDTPLHLASKFGNVAMVELLLSYPECKLTRNNEGKLAQHIICLRSSSIDGRQTKIEELFKERYYVPVLRSVDSSIPAQIGQPFAANNPPQLNCDPLSPEVEIKALAGPMTQDQAKKFYRRWKTPPRLGSNVSSPIANNPFISPMKSRNSLPSTPRDSGSATNSPTAMLQRRSLFNSTPHRTDERHNGTNETNGFADQSSLILNDSFDDHQNGNQDKENEREAFNKQETNNNHSVENKFKGSLCPGTPLFKIKRDAFFTYREQNLASPMPGCLETDYMHVSDIYDSPGYKERHVKNTDAEKGIECIGRNLAKEQNVEWQEYWDFLEKFIDIASEKGIAILEKYLAQKQADYESEQNKKRSIGRNAEMLEDVCSALEKFGFVGTSNADATDANSRWRNGINQRFENGFRSSNPVPSNMNASAAQQSATPYTYVEKSLQVHARRMTKTIVHNIENEVSINDALLLELRRVKSLIYSFKEDASFANVNFEKVHSRIGNLVGTFLENSQEISSEMKAKILNILRNLLRQQGERREHIECVCSRILHKLENPVEQILPENLKTEDMCSKVWSQENDCNCQWESNLSRKTSHRNRMEARYKNHQRMKQQEKSLQQQQVNEKISTEYRNPKVDNDSSDDIDENVFWSDFGSDSDEEEVFFTPPDSPTNCHRLNEVEDDDDGYKHFIYGSEPTKRDLDVLHAIFHVDINKAKYPTIHSWKSALMRYSNDEMDFFPSPRVVKKSHTYASTANKTDPAIPPQTPTSHKKPQPYVRSISSSSITYNSSGQAIIREPILQLPTAKRLFASPGKPTFVNTAEFPEVKDAAATTTALTPNSISQTAAAESAVNNEKSTGVNIALRSIRPLTPLNKIRGLFSSYRERMESSPLPSLMSVNERVSKEETKNLSLLNISESDYLT